MDLTFDEKNYIQWLRDIKPKWTEKQILHSAGAKFKKNFIEEPKEIKVEKPSSGAVPKADPGAVKPPKPVKKKA